MAKKYYNVNTEKKVITIDVSVTPTAADNAIISLYLQNGYILRAKSEKRAAAAKARAEQTGFGKKKEEA
jgi:hypothetical protein